MTELFDIASKTYDQDFTNTKIGRLQREMVWKYLSPNINTSNTLDILELNCGTGEDAVHMAKSGNTVIATDISPEMVFKTREKSLAHQVDHLITSQTLDLRDISNKTWDQKFDIIFSNFGGLNCISQIEIQRLKQVLVKSLKPGGKLIMVVMPRFCIWESIYFLLKLRLNQVFRRKRDSVIANVSGVQVETWYYSPKKISSLFSPEFEKTRVKSIGFFAPPSYMESFIAKRSFLFRTICFFEKNLSHFSWQSKMADHYYIELSAK